MSIAGTGVDLVEVSRIAEVIERHGDRFLGRVFTASETAYCQSHGVPEQHFAGRFAVKEAVLKALGTGWRGRIRWTDIDVSRDAYGAPHVTLSGAAGQRAAELHIETVHVSLSHTRQHAIAHAIAEARAR